MGIRIERTALTLTVCFDVTNFNMFASNCFKREKEFFNRPRGKTSGHPVGPTIHNFELEADS